MNSFNFMSFLLDFPLPSAPPLENESWASDSDLPPRITRLTQLTTKKTIYVRKIEVTLNGTPIDQVEDKVIIKCNDN
jgi:hypothetical protein